jgi:hypothetical protein
VAAKLMAAPPAVMLPVAEQAAAAQLDSQAPPKQLPAPVPASHAAASRALGLRRTDTGSAVGCTAGRGLSILGGHHLAECGCGVAGGGRGRRRVGGGAGGSGKAPHAVHACTTQRVGGRAACRHAELAGLPVAAGRSNGWKSSHVSQAQLSLRLPDQLKVAVSPLLRARGWYGVLCTAAAGKEILAGLGASDASG